MEHLVSIVIPTYGRPITLKRSINSALNQTYSKIEVIVVDDNNPDTQARKITESVLLEFDDERLMYLKHDQNRNGAVARNTGIQSASGNYIAFLDDDDEYETNKISKQLNYLLKNEKYGAVYCKAKHFRNNKLYYKTQYNKEGNIQYDILTLRHEFNTSSLLVSAEVLGNIGGFDEKFIRHQDFELLLRINDKYNIGCVDEYLLKVHNDDTANQPTLNQYEETKKIFFDEFSQYISRYDGRKKRAIYRNQYFSIAYYALKNKRLFKAIKYFAKSRPNFSTLAYAVKKAKKIFKRIKVSFFSEN